MKIPLNFHGAWSLTAVGTFALGFLLAKPTESEIDAKAATQTITIAGTSGQSGSVLSMPGHRQPGGLITAAESSTNRRQVLLDPKEIDALAKEALNDPNPLTRNAAFTKLLASMTPENAEALMESMKTNRASGDKWQLFLYAWGAMDSAGVLTHAEKLEGGAKARFLQSTLPGWASKDPAGATAWVEKMEEGDAKRRYLGTLVGGLADHDITTATNYVLARAAAGDKQAGEYLKTVTGEQLRKIGPAAATDWGEQLPDSPLKGEALDEIAGAYANEDPKAAAAWATKLAATDYGARVVREVGDEWAERDPQSAVAWLGKLSEGPARSGGTYSALREWTQRDPTAASKYLTGLAPSASKDSAVSGFARSLAREDPESAIIWAKTIRDEASRIQTLTRAGQSWFLRDPAAATTWLQTENLPQNAQKAILNPPRDERGRRG
jgi:hypothetical protein